AYAPRRLPPHRGARSRAPTARGARHGRSASVRQHAKPARGALPHARARAAAVALTALCAMAMIVTPAPAGAGIAPGGLRLATACANQTANFGANARTLTLRFVLHGNVTCREAHRTMRAYAR